MEEQLVLAFLAVALVMLSLLLVFICRELYFIFEEPHIQKRMRSLVKNKQPSVTVLLYARNHETTIESSLKAILRNKYQNFDIVVVNDRSKDSTAQCVKLYIKNNPNSAVRLVNSYKAKTAKQVLQTAYKKSNRGEVVISLRATTIVPSDFIKRAVATHFQKEYTMLRVSEPVSTNSLTEIIKALNNLIWHRSKQVAVSNAQNIMPIKLEVNPEIIGLVVLIFIISVSIITNLSIIIWFSWLIITAYIFGVIWVTQQSVKSKSKLSFSAISALFLLPVSSLLQGYSQLRSRK